jgi:hypothetical protein
MRFHIGNARGGDFRLVLETGDTDEPTDYGDFDSITQSMPRPTRQYSPPNPAPQSRMGALAIARLRGPIGARSLRYVDATAESGQPARPPPVSLQS